MYRGHPISYVSKALGHRNRFLSVYEKQFLSILLAVEQWQQYLQLTEFIIQTDQRSLTSLSDQRLHTNWQPNALTKLLGLQYKIQYKKGIETGVDDSLSCRRHSSAELHHMSIVQPTWLFDIISMTMMHSLKRCYKKLVADPTIVSKFTLKMGCFALITVSMWGRTLNCMTCSFRLSMLPHWVATLVFL